MAANRATDGKKVAALPKPKSGNVAPIVDTGTKVAAVAKPKSVNVAPIVDTGATAMPTGGDAMRELLMSVNGAGAESICAVAEQVGKKTVADGRKSDEKAETVDKEEKTVEVKVADERKSEESKVVVAVEAGMQAKAVAEPVPVEKNVDEAEKIAQLASVLKVSHEAAAQVLKLQEELAARQATALAETKAMEERKREVDTLARVLSIGADEAAIVYDRAQEAKRKEQKKRAKEEAKAKSKAEEEKAEQKKLETIKQLALVLKVSHEAAAEVLKQQEQGASRRLKRVAKDAGPTPKKLNFGDDSKDRTPVKCIGSDSGEEDVGPTPKKANLGVDSKDRTPEKSKQKTAMKKTEPTHWWGVRLEPAVDDDTYLRWAFGDASQLVPGFELPSEKLHLKGPAAPSATQALPGWFAFRAAPVQALKKVLASVDGSVVAVTPAHKAPDFAELMYGLTGLVPVKRVNTLMKQLAFALETQLKCSVWPLRTTKTVGRHPAVRMVLQMVVAVAPGVTMRDLPSTWRLVELEEMAPPAVTDESDGDDAAVVSDSEMSD